MNACWIGKAIRPPTRKLPFPSPDRSLEPAQPFFSQTLLSLPSLWQHPVSRGSNQGRQEKNVGEDRPGWWTGKCNRLTYWIGLSAAKVRKGCLLDVSSQALRADWESVGVGGEPTDPFFAIIRSLGEPHTIPILYRPSQRTSLSLRPLSFPI